MVWTYNGSDPLTLALDRLELAREYFEGKPPRPGTSQETLAKGLLEALQAVLELHRRRDQQGPGCCD